MLEPSRDFRIAVADDLVRSLSFKVGRHRQDVYWTCREVPEVKHSLHESGIHRFAEHTEQPRLAYDKATLVDLPTGSFRTIGRMVFTTWSAWSSFERGAGLQRGIRLAPVPFTLVSLGFTAHHPQEHPDTRSRWHLAVLRVAERKYLTATLATFDQRVFVRDILTLHAPHMRSPFDRRLVERPGDDERVDVLSYYRTKMNTFVYWAQHGVPRSRVAQTMALHPVERELNRVYAYSRQGFYFGFPPAS